MHAYSRKVPSVSSVVETPIVEATKDRLAVTLPIKGDFLPENDLPSLPDVLSYSPSRYSPKCPPIV
ncbi:hypothetical protein [Pontixanthobacter sp. CEM42]|uniref:hypothetical protein n=1 Tax=Pontixanthobacter sp. CEM42 TaxID=2792077 RepID=UPI001AE048EB|nr:hypothetical protein [Pontixanthobacter sp. CEM42]